MAGVDAQVLQFFKEKLLSKKFTNCNFQRICDIITNQLNLTHYYELIQLANIRLDLQRICKFDNHPQKAIISLKIEACALAMQNEFKHLYRQPVKFDKQIFTQKRTISQCDIEVLQITPLRPSKKRRLNPAQFSK